MNQPFVHVLQKAPSCLRAACTPPARSHEQLPTCKRETLCKHCVRLNRLPQASQVIGLPAQPSPRDRSSERAGPFVRASQCKGCRPRSWKQPATPTQTTRESSRACCRCLNCSEIHARHRTDYSSCLEERVHR